MPGSPTSHVLATAIGAVTDLMQRKLRSSGGEDATALQAGLEELAVLQDELQSQADQLARERRRFGDLFEFLPAPCLLTDALGHVRDANRAAAELLQLRAGDATGKPLAVFIAADGRAQFRSRLTAFFGNEYAGTESWETMLLPRDGRAFPALLAVRAIHPPQPSDLCWLIRPAR